MKLQNYSYLIIILAVHLLSFSKGLSQQSKCNIMYNGVDLQTKEKRIELAPSLIFNYSPPEVKNSLQEGNLIACKGQLLRVEDDLLFHMNIRVNSLLAPKEYGQIDVDNIVKIILINGKEIEMKCYAGSAGIKSDEGAYIYPVGYKMSTRIKNQLSGKEIDKIGIQWSSGYEEYIIYEVDFFQNQIKCLNRAIQKPN